MLTLVRQTRSSSLERLWIGSRKDLRRLEGGFERARIMYPGSALVETGLAGGGDGRKAL